METPAPKSELRKETRFHIAVDCDHAVIAKSGITKEEFVDLVNQQFLVSMVESLEEQSERIYDEQIVPLQEKTNE
jgi:hypothetical protein